MDIRLSRDDLNQLLTLVESGQIHDAERLFGWHVIVSATPSFDADASGSTSDTSDANSILAAFGQYFDRGLDAAGEGADISAILGQQSSVRN